MQLLVAAETQQEGRLTFYMLQAVPYNNHTISAIYIWTRCNSYITCNNTTTTNTGECVFVQEQQLRDSQLAAERYRRRLRRCEAELQREQSTTRVSFSSTFSTQDKQYYFKAQYIKLNV